jgi:hypothetical protein
MLKVDGRRTPSDGKSSPCLWQRELKMHILTFSFEKSYFSPRAARGVNCIEKREEIY